MDKQITIKAEIFDILAQQEQITFQNQQLEKIKQGKLQELREAIEKEMEQKEEKPIE